MCGIAGLLTSLPRGQARDVIRRMVRSLYHRGPDGCGVVEMELAGKEGYAMLGHSRLSILDLTTQSSQPMRDEKTGSWLIYNGEIYNFRELRRVIEGQGVCFRSCGDTEVLLQALVLWGEAALPRLRGMFAFAFWSGITQELMLVRDPLGIKPLYYSQLPSAFLFASEVRTLPAAGIAHFSPDPVGIHSFLTYGAVTGPHTAWEQAKEFSPGSVLKLRRAGDNLKVERYWSFRTAVTPGRGVRFDDAVEQVNTRLSQAVDSHLMSDVPLGIFLSGGVDSSLLACMASKRQRDVTLLTIGFPDLRYSEIPYATEVARRLSLPHQVVSVSGEDFQKLLARGLEALDQPSVDGLNTYMISGVGSSRGLRVLLSGVGGDELFGGYTTFRKAPWLLRYQRWLRLGATVACRFSSNPVQWTKIAEHGRFHSLLEAYLLQRSIRWQDAAGVSTRAAASLWKELSEEMEPEADDFLHIASLELLFYTRNQLLRDADVFSMAHSVELRVPLLDLDLLTTALSIPKAYHFDRRGGKRILRAILRNLGLSLPHRRKQGFSFPWTHWLRSHLKAEVGETLRERGLYDKLGLDFADGMRLMRNFEAGVPTVSWSEVWSLFVLLRWQRRNQSSEYQFGRVAGMTPDRDPVILAV